VHVVDNMFVGRVCAAVILFVILFVRWVSTVVKLVVRLWIVDVEWLSRIFLTRFRMLRPVGRACEILSTPVGAKVCIQHECYGNEHRSTLATAGDEHGK